MPFILSPNLLPRRPRAAPMLSRTHACAPRPPLPPGHDLVDDGTSSDYLRTLLANLGGSAPSPSPSSSSPSPSSSSSSSSSAPPSVRPPASDTVATARMAASSTDPSPTPSSTPPPRRRGRPKGSRNRRPSSSSASSSSTPLSPTVSAPPAGTLRAPSGHRDGPRDLLQDLLPLLARDEMESQRDETEHEIQVREMLRESAAIVASTHRQSNRERNLKPFASRRAPKKCKQCSTTGMITCSYCKGEGFVDLGEDAAKFYEDFPDESISLPPKATGNIYHCPLCGGLKEERCDRCFGTGFLEDAEKQPKDAAAKDMDGAWKPFDMDKFLMDNADHIEIGLDGTIILRKQERRGRKKKVQQAEAKDSDKNEDKVDDDSSKKSLSQPDTNVTMLQSQISAASPVTEPVKRKRGRPRKRPISENDVALPPPTQSASKPEVAVNPALLKRSSSLSRTDFVNTTDYQVGRKLRSQETVVPRAGFIAPDERNLDAEGNASDSDVGNEEETNVDGDDVVAN